MADEFGQLLKKHRKQTGLSQAQIVEGLRKARYEDRYSKSDVSKWEHGSRIPPEDVVEELEEIVSTPKGLLLRAAGYGSAAEYRRLQAAELAPSQVAVAMQREATEREERRKLLTSLQWWQEQLQFLSLDQLLKSYLENRASDLKREITEPEEVRQAYLDVATQHWETIPRPHKVMLPVESETSFQWLKKSYPDADVWQAQELWGHAYGIYLDAFGPWFGEVERVSELLMGFAVKAVKEEGDSGSWDSRVTNAQQLVKKVKRRKSDVWLFLRLLALTAACDLLLLGIEEQPPHAFWAPETMKIKELRHTVVLTSLEELPKDFWLTGGNRVYGIAKLLWDKDELVKKKTIALVKALERLQTAQNNVHAKLKSLELRFI